MDRLLAQEDGSTLASISTWADEVRSPTTAAWHYVNFPGNANCEYDPKRMCVEGKCVVGAIQRQTELLRPGRTDESRLKALKWLVHLVADTHQPLHGGYVNDRGGNQFQVQAFDRGTNLHAVWDFGLIGVWPGGAAALHRKARAQALLTRTNETAAVTDSSSSAWVIQSCTVASSSDFYPEGRVVTQGYRLRWEGTLVDQLAATAVHLARLLGASMTKKSDLSK